MKMQQQSGVPQRPETKKPKSKSPFEILLADIDARNKEESNPKT